MAAVIQIDGVNRVLQELYYLDRRLHREITGRLKRNAKPLIDKVSEGFPAGDALDRWGASAPGLRTRGGFPKYYGPAAKSGIKARTGGRTDRLTRMTPILKIVQTDPAGAVFDIAGRSSTGNHPNFIPNLKGKQGAASRVMWPKVLETIPTVQDEMQKAVDDATKAVTDALGSGIQSRTAKQSQLARSRSRTALGRFGAVRI